MLDIGNVPSKGMWLLVRRKVLRDCQRGEDDKRGKEGKMGMAYCVWYKDEERVALCYQSQETRTFERE